jgi:hypothetical protein
LIKQTKGKKELAILVSDAIEAAVKTARLMPPFKVDEQRAKRLLRPPRLSQWPPRAAPQRPPGWSSW